MVARLVASSRMSRRRTGPRELRRLGNRTSHRRALSRAPACTRISVEQARPASSAAQAHRTARIRPALVVMLHGAGFGSDEQAERSYGWDELADSSGVRRRLSRTASGWPGTSTGAAAVAGPPSKAIDDVGFITARRRRHQAQRQDRRLTRLRHRHEQRRHDVVHPGV